MDDFEKAQQRLQARKKAIFDQAKFDLDTTAAAHARLRDEDAAGTADEIARIEGERAKNDEDLREKGVL